MKSVTTNTPHSGNWSSHLPVEDASVVLFHRDGLVWTMGIYDATWGGRGAWFDGRNHIMPLGNYRGFREPEHDLEKQQAELFRQKLIAERQ